MKHMTNAQLDAFLETLARFIEQNAKSPEEAAEIVRNAKTGTKQKDEVTA